MLDRYQEGSMIINDDAPMTEVVEKTVAALQESAAHIGKADRAITETQVQKIKDAIARLESTLQFKPVTKG